MILNPSVFLALLGLTSVNALTVSKNTLISTGDTSFNEDVTINAGDFLAIDSGYTHNFLKDLFVYGTLYISDKQKHSGITCDLIGSGTYKNYGEVVLNHLNGTSAPTFSWQGAYFYNYGDMWLAGIGNTGGSTMNIRPTNYFYNSGTITLYQSGTRTGGTCRLGKDGGSITNDGTVCLQQNIYDQYSSISGSGCFDIGINSNFHITNSHLYTISEAHTFLLSSSSSSLRIDNYKPSQRFHVAGWGNNNVIGFNCKIKSFTYSGDTLSIVVGSYTYYIVIGTGYDSTKMRIGAADYGSGSCKLSNTNFGLLYSGAPPSSARPSTCKACPAIPNPPACASSTSSPNPTKTITSTVPGGKATSTVTKTQTHGGTDTVIVEIPSSCTTSTKKGKTTSTKCTTSTKIGKTSSTKCTTSTKIGKASSTGCTTTTRIGTSSSTGTITTTINHVTVTITTTWTGEYTTTETHSASPSAA
ncbi:hypothetical protein CLIB1423_20S02278 [[Candida] railenensis]|uniref:Hyphally-regulated cell wall protein N-terminal domain-containing protein n=1 Tax=[Candida] railenensis TaxID=45579 RepID=A0A9P0QSX7_9ASCO|nr:hypothetical protein CLIB1423_20S02278 [[Candida] railenensis]